MKKPWTDLNLSSLKYFVDVVTFNSFSQAAEINCVSRPAISQAIKRLEGHLGYPLLEHQKKHLVLTTYGSDFYLRAKAAIENLGKNLENPSPQSSLRLACSATLAEYVVLPWINEVNLSPNTNIRIGTSAKVRNLVNSGASNVGLLIDDEQTFGFETKVLRKGNFEFQSKTGKLEYPIITTELRPEVVSALKVIPEEAPRIQIESWSICHKMAITLGGTCLVPDLIVRSDLKRVPLKAFRYEYKLIAITKNRNLLSNLERKLFEKSIR